MRPERDDIAAPELPAGLEWVGEAPPSMAALTAVGPVLVHFFDFAQLNSVRTLPYLAEWHDRYADLGLAVLGLQAPRFPFGADRACVARGLRRLGIGLPVAIDAERELWLDYGCEGWPSLFLWGQGGALRWFHFGEGEYLGTELAIQEELRLIDALRPMPDPMAPLRATDTPGATVIAPTPELIATEGRPWTIEDGGGMTIEYEAAGAWATVEGEGEIGAALDGGPERELAVEGAGLYRLAEHPSHGAHSLRIGVGPGLAVWSISFEPGPAP